MQDDLYKLIATKKQFDIIAAALDFYARFGCGQIHPSITNLCFSSPDQFGGCLANLNNKEFDSACAILKNLLFNMNLHQSHSIVSGELGQNFKACYDSYQVIKHVFAIEDGSKPPYHIDYDKPIQTSKFPLPEFQKESCQNEEEDSSPDNKSASIGTISIN